MTMEQNVRNDELEIDLMEIIQVLWRWAWVIAASAVGVALIAFIYSKVFITPTYQSKTRIVVLNQSNSDSLTVSDLNLGTQLSNDYKELIRSRDVVETVIETFMLNTTYEGLVKNISVSSPSNTRIIDITLTHTNPALAKEMVDKLREVAAVKIKDIMAVDAVNLVDEGNLPTSPSAPNVKKYTLLGFLIGAFLAMAVIVVLYLLDDTIKSSEDIEKYLKLSTLGMIPILETEEERKKRQTRRLSRKELEDEREEREAREHTKKMAVVDLSDVE